MLVYYLGISKSLIESQLKNKKKAKYGGLWGLGGKEK